MRYRPALFDNSDPLYAPGLNWSGRYAYWKPTKQLKERGCPVKPIRLPGTKGDGRDAERAERARKLTRKALGTYKPIEGPAHGTWEWAIAEWKADEHSTYRTCGPAQKISYDYISGKWVAVLGNLKISELTYKDIGGALAAMQAKSYSPSLIKKMFSYLGQIARYALGPLGQTEARSVVDTLKFLRLKGGKRRDVAPTPGQIRAIIDEADARGLFAFATGLLFQWTYAFRAVDVRGQWFEADESAGGVIRNGQRWQDGLTWDMFDADLTMFSKVISKTKTQIINVHLTPELRARLILLKNAGAVGPVITSERLGEPYTRRSWTQAFCRIRNYLEIPSNVQMRDTRAGALTEAKNLGVGPLLLRDAALHTNTSMTDVYTREKSTAINKVVDLRRRK